MKKIICLSGKQYSGKDTVAKILIDYFSQFERIAIGDAIKLEYGKIHNLTYYEIDSNKGIYRTGLIELGNEGRAKHPDFWLNKIIELDKNIIVPDIRLVHEAEVFKNAGAFLIRVEAGIEIRSKRGVVTNENDPTECALDNYGGFDFKIQNENGINELKEASKPLIEAIKRHFNI
ncbi:MAG: hypothetical protein LUH11_01440 [Candidatus Gastranaerophilales bacterium]|nr:hypothetical protein [Candidatus Gastranaerophilales bacterium]